MSKLKSILRIALIEAVNNLFSIKGLTVFLTLFFFVRQELDDIIMQSTYYECKIGWAILPYLHSKVIYTLIFAFSILYYYSDVPFLSDKSNYQLLRVGRNWWFIIKSARIFLGAVLLMFMELLVSILACFPRVEFGSGWGVFWNTVSLEQGIDISFPRNIITLYSPFEATMRVFLVGCFIVYLLGMLEFAVTLFFGKKYAIIICGILACGPVLAANSDYANIYYISPVSWIGIVEHSLAYHYTGPRISYMYFMLLIIIAILEIIIKRRVKYMDL